MLAQLPGLPPEWQGTGLILVAAGLAVLAILRWRDGDVKKITVAIEAKLNAEWALKYDEVVRRVTDLESKLSHLENGTREATIKAVEIKATSQESRTIELARGIIGDLSLKPEQSLP